ncbi:capsule biosynthesis protein [Piscirickettsia salmonis]|uniref:capsular polysaccharide export protein, LipB/KpsS family n=1 Tax=Piscirickettsia salmonis TaxID=1238 RepID=UPI003EB7B0E8
MQDHHFKARMKNKQNLLIVGLLTPLQVSALNLALTSCNSKIHNLHHITKTPVDSNSLGYISYHLISYDQMYYLQPETISEVPVDAEILDALAQYEPTLLKMLDRVYPQKKRYRYFDLKRHLYYAYLSYWITFFTKNDITKIIFHNIPHEGYDYVIYMLAKYYDIPIRIAYQLQVIDSYIIADDIKSLFTELEAAHHNLENDDIHLNDLSPRMQREYQLRMQKSMPFYMQPKKKSLLKHIYHHLQRKYFPISERDKMMANELIHPSLKYVRQTTLESPYIYFALHYQPEMTTVPLGGVYADQFLAIQLISKALPKNMKLYIKEHPAIYKKRNPSGRFTEFYKKIAALPNTQIVPQTLSSFKLIEKSQAVATITGTAGWEALFLNKPVLVFGNIFYQHCPGAYPIHSYECIQKAMDTIFLHKQKPKQQSLIKFLKILDDKTKNGVVDFTYLNTSLTNKEQLIKQLSLSLKSMLTN